MCYARREIFYFVHVNFIMFLYNLGSPPNDYKIVSALRAVADRCDRLWVIDTGVTNYASATPRNIQLPTIFIYDLKTDQLIRKYPIPQDQVVEDAYFANIVSK